MKKIFACILLSAILLCGCSTKTNQNINNIAVINNNPTPVEINETQMYDIYDKVSHFASGETLSGNLDEIYDITSANQIREIEVAEGIFYYNILEYKGNKLTLIYDSEHQVCGCIYYNTPVDSKKLKSAINFEDVENTDTTLLNNGCGLNQLSANTLISRRLYNPNSESSDILSATLHYTDNGLYLITYDKSLYTENSSNIKVVSIEKVDDMVYNKVYELTNK